MKISFHHVNIVSKNPRDPHNFYTQVLGLEDIPEARFSRTIATEDSGYEGSIKFAGDGNVEMHLAEKNLEVAAKNNQFINPVERGHIAFRTDDIIGFKKHLQKNGISFADYGTTFSQEWHQIFFYDPDGNVIEVHQVL